MSDRHQSDRVWLSPNEEAVNRAPGIPTRARREFIAVDAVDELLRAVSRDFAGAHVNAGAVCGYVRQALRAGSEEAKTDAR